MSVLGIDPATHIGLTTFIGTEIRCKAIEVNQRGFSRLQSIAAEVERVVIGWAPSFAVIEGYAFCRNVDGFICLVEIGTVIRQVLHKHGVPWVEVPPTVLKKWVTGRGTADKESMAKHTEVRWNFRNNNSDIIDSFGLAQMGKELGREGLIEFLKSSKKKGKGVQR